ncbi:MAG TPA: hypothetical protein VML55_09255 [Planctomycetaceae bacterium]|nr:hypothetical protein [Planctomycetaceae bacterium]
MIDSLTTLPTRYVVAMSLWLVAGVFALRWLLLARRRWKDQPRRLRWANALLSAWMFLAALTAIELYFAVIYDESDSFNMTNVSKKWYYRHVDRHRRWLTIDAANNRGMSYRDDREFPTRVTADQQHICFIGDSFTLGHGVPEVADRFSNRVRRALELREPGRYAVSNLAEAGTHLLWVADHIEALLRNNHPIDTFVYVLCLNDIEPFELGHDSFYRDLGSHGPSFFLFRDTYFFNLAYFRFKQFTLPEVRNYYSFVREFYDGPAWERMRAKLLDVAAMCRRQGAEFQVVVFPFLHNLGSDYPFADAHARIVAACGEAGIPVLDLAPVLAPHVDEGLMVNRFDAHPNERAHALAAQAIEEWLIGEPVPNPRHQISNKFQAPISESSR